MRFAGFVPLFGARQEWARGKARGPGTTLFFSRSTFAGLCALLCRVRTAKALLVVSKCCGRCFRVRQDGLLPLHIIVRRQTLFCPCMTLFGVKSFLQFHAIVHCQVFSYQFPSAPSVIARLQILCCRCMPLFIARQSTTNFTLWFIVKPCTASCPFQFCVIV